MSDTLEKALTLAEGAALVPEKVEPEIVDIVVKHAPLVKLLREINWTTSTYEWNERTAIMTGSAYDAGDPFASEESAYTRRSVQIKRLKVDGAVDKLLAVASEDLVNALQSEIEAASAAMGYLLEKMYIQGNSAVNPKEFDGLSAQITKVYDAAGSPLTLDILDAAIERVEVDGGKPNLIILSHRDLNKLHRIMRDKMVYAWERVEVAAGVLLTTYRGIPLYASSYVPMTDDGLAEAYILDTTHIVVPVLRKITYEDMTPKVVGEFTAFRINTWRALAVKGAGVFHCKIIRLGA